MGKSKITSNLISRITGELVTTTMDLVVLSAAFAGGLILFGPSGKDLYADEKLNNAMRASALIYKKWNKSSFRKAVGRATGDGLLKKIEYGFGLTAEGEKRLKTILPAYKKPSHWEGKLWLIIYDIPEERRKARNKLRKLLLEIGSRMVQESVWLSIKDPTPWIKGYISGSKKGSIIISCLGKDGSVSGESLPELLNRIFGLKKLNKEYKKWIESSEKDVSEEQKTGLALRYLFLLRCDPMFPGELLPVDWLGEKAMDIFDKEYRSELEIGQYIKTAVHEY